MKFFLSTMLLTLGLGGASLPAAELSFFPLVPEVSLSPKGTWVVGASRGKDSEIQVANYKSGDVIFRLKEKEYFSTLDLSFSSDEKFFGLKAHRYLSIDGNRPAKTKSSFYETKNWQKVSFDSCVAENILSYKFSPDSKYLLLACGEKQIQVIDLATRKMVFKHSFVLTKLGDLPATIFAKDSPDHVVLPLYYLVDNVTFKTSAAFLRLNGKDSKVSVLQTSIQENYITRIPRGGGKTVAISPNGKTVAMISDSRSLFGRRMQLVLHSFNNHGIPYGDSRVINYPEDAPQYMDPFVHNPAINVTFLDNQKVLAIYGGDFWRLVSEARPIAITYNIKDNTIEKDFTLDTLERNQEGKKGYNLLTRIFENRKERQLYFWSRNGLLKVFKQKNGDLIKSFNIHNFFSQPSDRFFLKENLKKNRLFIRAESKELVIFDTKELSVQKNISLPFTVDDFIFTNQSEIIYRSGHKILWNN